MTCDPNCRERLTGLAHSVGNTVITAPRIQVPVFCAAGGLTNSRH